MNAKQKRQKMNRQNIGVIIEALRDIGRCMVDEEYTDAQFRIGAVYGYLDCIYQEMEQEEDGSGN